MVVIVAGEKKMELDIHKRPKTVDASAPDTGTITSNGDIDVPVADKSDVLAADNLVGDRLNEATGDRPVADPIHIVGRTPG